MGATSVRVAVVDLDAERRGSRSSTAGCTARRAARRLRALALARAARQRPARARPGARGGAGRLDRRRRLGRRLRPARRATAACSRIRTATAARAPSGWREVARVARRGRALPPHRRPADADQHDLPARRTRPRRAATGTPPRDAARARRLRAHRRAGGERSNAGTTGLARRRDRRLGGRPRGGGRRRPGDPAALESAGRLLGEHRGVPVHLVAAHDTACAVAASPLGNGRPRVRLRRHLVPRRHRASGGRHVRGRAGGELLERAGAARRLPVPQERDRVLAARALRRGMGDLERPRSSSWRAPCRESASVFDVHDERFLAPERMDDEVRAPPASRGRRRAVVARSIVESIAAGVASVVDELRRLHPIEELAVVGGGAASPLVRDLLADHARAEVVPERTRRPRSATRSSRASRSVASATSRRRGRGRPTCPDRGRDPSRHRPGP